MIHILRIKILSILILFTSCSDQTNNDAEYFVSEISKELNFPFSDAAIVGDIIYVSGQIGSKPGTREVVEGGIFAETIQTLNNIKMILNDLGSNSNKIFKCLCMLEDINDYTEMNNAYTMFFNSRDNLPSRSTFAGSGLALGAKIEIECWATK
jgi:2-iminobutanoate/2-iminopropanoate deaminase|tara:strand:+ start:387 stop:845 length:459 start_codon:yes stop_codon:yes gene_type:complete